MNKLIAFMAAIMVMAVASNSFAQQAGADGARAPETCDAAARAVAIATATDTQGGVHQDPVRERNASERARIVSACGNDSSRADQAFQAAAVQMRTTCRPVRVTPVGPPRQVVRRGDPICTRGAVARNGHCECPATFTAPPAERLNQTDPPAPGAVYNLVLHRTEARTLQTRNGRREVVVREVGICVLASADNDSMENGVNSVVRREIVTEIQDAIRALRGQTHAICAHPGANNTTSHDCDDFNRWLMEQLRNLQGGIDLLRHDLDGFEQILMANGITSTSNVVPRIEALERRVNGRAVFGEVGADVRLVLRPSGPLTIGANASAGLRLRLHDRFDWYVRGEFGGASFGNEVGGVYYAGAASGVLGYLDAERRFALGGGFVGGVFFSPGYHAPDQLQGDLRGFFLGGEIRFRVNIAPFFFIQAAIALGYGQAYWLVDGQSRPVARGGSLAGTGDGNGGFEAMPSLGIGFSF